MNVPCRNGYVFVWALLAAAHLHAQPVSGDAPPPPEQNEAVCRPCLQLSGFGTLGMVYTGARNLRFTRVNVNQSGGENPALGPDTVLGVQGNLSFGQNVSAVVQVVSRENALGDYAPNVNLAFLNLALTPQLTVRAGRLRTPFFMLSETFDLNYANPWIRPPVEIYGMFPFNEFDGIDFLMRTHFGGFNVEFHPYLGRSVRPLFHDGRGRLQGGGLNVTVTNGRLSVFAAHGRARFSMKWKEKDFTAFSNALSAAPNGERILQSLSGGAVHGTFSSVGFQWDDSRWLLIGEYNRLRPDRYIHEGHAWEITAARRFGRFMPYLTLAKHSNDKQITQERTGVAFLDAVLEAHLAARNLAQRSATLGLRWDFYRNAAFKLEYGHAKVGKRAWGSFYPKDPMSTRVEKRHVNTVGASVDFMF